MGLPLMLNGKPREVEELEAGASLQQVIEALGMRPDRIAVERNGEIVARARWAQQAVQAGDKLEVVHFVGGGCLTPASLDALPHAARGRDGRGSEPVDHARLCVGEATERRCCWSCAQKTMP